MANFTQLPHKCFACILSYLSLNELMHLRLACRQFKTEIELLLRTRKLLILGNGTFNLTEMFFSELSPDPHCSRQMQDKCRLLLKRPYSSPEKASLCAKFNLQYEKLTPEFVRALKRLFPKLSHLVLSFSVADDISARQIPRLLLNWSKTLTTLVWAVQSCEKLDPVKMNKCANKFTQLCRFRLEGYLNEAKLWAEFPFESILDRIECFSFVGEEDVSRGALPYNKQFSYLISMLNSNDLRFEFDGPLFRKHLLDLHGREGDDPTPKCTTHLSLCFSPDSLTAPSVMVKFICEKFLQLIELRLNFKWTNEVYRVNLRQFCTLPNLESLSLSHVELDLDQCDRMFNLRLLNVRTLSLKALQLTSALSYHDTRRFGACLARIFANLEYLNIGWSHRDSHGDLQKGFKRDNSEFCENFAHLKRLKEISIL